VPRRKTTPAPTSAQGSSARIQARRPDERDDVFEEDDDLEASDDEVVGELDEVGEEVESGTLRFRTKRGGWRYRRCLGGPVERSSRKTPEKSFGVGSEARCRVGVDAGCALEVDHSTIVPASPRV
jgi:hypothetical protein